MRTTFLAILLASPMSQPALAEKVSPRPDVGASRAFGDWIVGCDNLKTCTAIGMVAEGAAPIAYLKVQRDAGADAEPNLSVVFLPEGDAADAALDLMLVGAHVKLPVDRFKASATDPYLAASVGAADTSAMLDALLKGDALEVREAASAEPARVSLRGMSASLRHMDAEQTRAGNVTAIVAKGEKEADAVPAPLAAPAPVPGVKLTAIEPVSGRHSTRGRGLPRSGRAGSL